MKMKRLVSQNRIPVNISRSGDAPALIQLAWVPGYRLQRPLFSFLLLMIIFYLMFSLLPYFIGPDSTPSSVASPLSTTFVHPRPETHRSAPPRLAALPFNTCFACSLCLFPLCMREYASFASHRTTGTFPRCFVAAPAVAVVGFPARNIRLEKNLARPVHSVLSVKFSSSSHVCLILFSFLNY